MIRTEKGVVRVRCKAQTVRDRHFCITSWQRHWYECREYQNSLLWYLWIYHRRLYFCLALCIVSLIVEWSSTVIYDRYSRFFAVLLSHSWSGVCACLAYPVYDFLRYHVRLVASDAASGFHWFYYFVHMYRLLSEIFCWDYSPLNAKVQADGNAIILYCQMERVKLLFT